MKITILCSSDSHPIYPRLASWAEARRTQGHGAELVTRVAAADGGDFLFLISCADIVSAETRERYAHSLVVHASALPKGRGWSPHVWQVIEGQKVIPVTLLEATDPVDTGPIWAQRLIELDGHELFDEINEKLFVETLWLMDFALDNRTTVGPRRQDDSVATYYRRRTPADSKLDPHKSFAEQFDLLRVADPERFPCFFDYRGKRFIVVLKKEDQR